MQGDPPEWEADFIKPAPMRRTGALQTLPTMSFLAHSEFITVQTMVVDGRAHIMKRWENTSRLLLFLNSVKNLPSAVQRMSPR